MYALAITGTTASRLVMQSLSPTIVPSKAAVMSTMLSYCLIVDTVRVILSHHCSSFVQTSPAAMHLQDIRRRGEYATRHIRSQAHLNTTHGIRTAVALKLLADRH